MFNSSDTRYIGIIYIYKMVFCVQLVKPKLKKRSCKMLSQIMYLPLLRDVFIVAFVVWIACIVFNAKLALKKNSSVYAWVLAGIVFTWISKVALSTMPSLEQK